MANTSQLIESCELALKVGHLSAGDVTAIESCLTRAENFRNRRIERCSSITERF